MDAGTGLEGLPVLLLWDLVIETRKQTAETKMTTGTAERDLLNKRNFDLFGSIDYVPLSLPISYGRARLYLLEDNDAAIKMTITDRIPQIQHVARTHRVVLDWLFERLHRDPNAFLKLVGTKEQVADILTKSSLIGEAWATLCELCFIMPIRKFFFKTNAEFSAEIKPEGTKPQANIAFFSPIYAKVTSRESNCLLSEGSLRPQLRHSESPASDFSLHGHLIRPGAVGNKKLCPLGCTASRDAQTSTSDIFLLRNTSDEK